MNKREFVLGGCAALTGAAASAGPRETSAADGPVPAGLRRQRLPDLATNLRSTAWSAYLGHRFRVQAPGTDVALVLRQVWPAPSTRGLEQFSLCFDADAPLQGGTHRLVHATGQAVMVYLEPTASAVDSRAALRADFNLLA